MPTATKTAEKTCFPGIHPAAFEHPIDRTALEILRKTPGLDRLIKLLASLGFERQVRLFFTADAIRITPRQRPEIYRAMSEACAILDMPEPELFLSQNPFPNAMAIGMDRFTIVVTSGLVDTLNEQELQFVIGHELGHIKSGHMLYRTMAIFLSIIGLIAAKNLPMLNLLTDVLTYALYDWSRKSELTADRAGLLTVQNRDVPVQALMKLAGGKAKDINRESIEEFLKQADDYEDMDASLLNVYYKFLMTRFQTHPFPAVRAREIDNWSQQEEYKNILAGNYRRTDGSGADMRCKACGAMSPNVGFKFCTECGAEL